MSWRDQLRRVTLPDGRRLIGASFRGVPFFVVAASMTGGRRTETHEFAGSDKWYVDDYGRRARTFPVEGYVVGDDYMDQRDALVAALDEVQGPGELVHPYYGVKRAVCSALNVQEVVGVGGMARFAIEFGEAPTQAINPTISVNHPARVSAAATAAQVAVAAEAEEAYAVLGQPSFAVASLSEALVAAGERMGQELEAIARTTQELALLNAEVNILVAHASALISTPGGMLDALGSVLSAVADTAQAAPRELAVALARACRSIVVVPAVGDTATRIRERANQEAQATAIRRFLAVEAARALPRAVFRSVEEALADRDSVVEIIDEQLDVAGDEAYLALSALRADLVSAVPGDAVLAQVRTLSQRTSVPSLLLSYQLYGSVRGESDIVARNRVRVPCFIFGDVQVLSDV